MVSGWWIWWGGAVGRIFPGVGPQVPKLGPSPSPAVLVLLQRKEMTEMPSPPLQPTAGHESLGCSIILGLQASGLPPPPSQPQNFALWL